MTAVGTPAPGAAPATRTPSPGVVLGATVVATTVVLGLATGTGPLVGPLGSAYAVGTGAVSLVLSVTLCTALGLGIVTGPMARRYGPRRLMAVAAVLVPAGLAVASATDDIAVAGIALAVGVGGGAGCVVVPMTSAVGAAFVRRHGAALVVATSGGGLATVLAPPAVVILLQELGPRGTLLALAVLSGAVLAGCVAASPGVPRREATVGGPAPGGPVRVASLLAEPGFRRLVVATVALTAAMFVPITHLPGYAVAHGMDLATGAALVTLAGIASLAGRLAAVPAVSRWGAWPVCRVGATWFVVAVVGWALVDGPVGLMAFAVAFGVGHGAYVGMAGAVTVALYGTEGLGARLGTLYAATAVGGLIGPATAGVAIDVGGTYSGAVAVAVPLGLAGVALLAAVRPPGGPSLTTR